MLDIRRGTYSEGYAPRDGDAVYSSLWDSCIGAYHPGLGQSGSTVRDISGRKNHGTMLESMVPATGWAMRQGIPALYGSGAANSITCGILPTFEKLSVSAWINFSSVTARNDAFGIWDNSNGYIFLITAGISSGNISFYVSDNSSFPVAISGTVTADTWYHVAGTYDGVNMRLYINGLLHATTATTVVPPVVTETLRLCSSGWITINARQYFTGYLTDVRIYNRAITSAEVSLLARRPGIAYELAPRRYFVGESVASAGHPASRRMGGVKFAGNQSLGINRW